MSETFCGLASKADLSEVPRLYAQPDLDDGEVLTLVQAQHVFDRTARYPDYKVYVAVSEGRIAGPFARLIMDNLAHRNACSAVIEYVAVDPGWRGRDVGKMMVRYALQVAAQKRGYKAVLSSNLKPQRAHMFYEALGFERHGYRFRLIAPQDAGAEG